MNTSTVRAISIGLLGLILVVCMDADAEAKGRARSFDLEGVIEISADSPRPTQFVLTGDLVVQDCRRRCETTTWQTETRIKVKIKFREGQFFAVRDPSRRAGAVREPAAMFELIRDAAAHRHRTRLELVDPVIRFDELGNVKEVEAELERMIDFHMK